MPEYKSGFEETNDRYAAVQTVNLIATGTQSTTANLDGKSPIRLLVGAGWSSTATIVHIDISDDGTTYYPLWASGTAYTVAVQESQAVSVDPTKFWGVGYIRLIGTLARGTAEAQSTACSVGIVTRLI